MFGVRSHRRTDKQGVFPARGLPPSPFRWRGESLEIYLFRIQIHLCHLTYDIIIWDRIEYRHFIGNTLHDLWRATKFLQLRSRFPGLGSLQSFSMPPQRFSDPLAPLWVIGQIVYGYRFCNLSLDMSVAFPSCGNSYGMWRRVISPAVIRGRNNKLVFCLSRSAILIEAKNCAKTAGGILI